jgi:3D (Asp-Asp-Asp) domain-containing protein
VAVVVVVLSVTALSGATAQELDTYAVAGTGGAGLELRSGPGRDTASVAVLPEGTLVHAAERVEVESGVWLAIQTPVGNGFGSAAYLAPRSVRATVVGYAAGGGIGATTATGTQTRWGTVAADWRVFPPGTRLQIEGFPDVEFVVEDTGSAVRGTLIDIWFPERATALDFGTQQRRVTVLP